MFKLLTVQEIRELIKLVDVTNIDEFVYEHDNSKIKMIKHGADTVTTVQPVLQATGGRSCCNTKSRNTSGCTSCTTAGNC